MTSVSARRDSDTDCTLLNLSRIAPWKGKVVCIITLPKYSPNYLPYYFNLDYKLSKMAFAICCAYITSHSHG